MELNLPHCASPQCPRPPSLWQRWWARHEGIHLEAKWYCSPDCFADGLSSRLGGIRRPVVRRGASHHRIPLGLILLSQGLITAGQLKEALECQRREGHGKIGHWLIAAGAVTEDEVTSALAVQQGCPVFSDANLKRHALAATLPLPLLRAFRALPVFYRPDGGRLFLGFVDAVSHALLQAVEHVLECRVEPCIVQESVYDEVMKQPVRESHHEMVTIEQRQSVLEMTNMVTDYAQQVTAETCRLAVCGAHLWSRLRRGDGWCLDLLFRLPEANEVASGDDVDLQFLTH